MAGKDKLLEDGVDEGVVGLGVVGVMRGNPEHHRLAAEEEAGSRDPANFINKAVNVDTRTIFFLYMQCKISSGIKSITINEGGNEGLVQLTVL